MSAAVEPAPVDLQRERSSVFVRLLSRPSAAISAVVLGILVLGAVAAPVVAPYSPTHNDYAHLFAAPSFSHLFGTDELGRDLLTRVLYGGRTSLQIAFAATVIAMVVGTLWGFAAAFRKGWIGETLMRSADVAMGLPAILLGLVLVAAFGAVDAQPGPHPRHPLRAGDRAARALRPARRAAVGVPPRRGVGRRLRQADRAQRALSRTPCRYCSRARAS